jgi:NAD-dependent SIR2 family protein deacetylase
LLKLGAGKPHGYFVYTSNVDGHFQRADFALDRVFECHGSIHHFQCAIPCGNQIWDATDESVSVDETAFRADDPLPKCRACGGLARPNILMFGDGQWNINRAQSQQVYFGRWLTALTTARARLVVVELGAGTAVPSVRHASEEMIDRLGAKLIRINPREPEVPPGQIGIAQGAAETIDRICRALAEIAD